MRLFLSHLARMACCLVVVALLMHGLVRANLLPAYLPKNNIDSLVLAYQFHSAKKPSGENILFVGDSSCLMDVVVADIEKESQGKLQGLNLGTLSFLPLEFFAELATTHIGRGASSPVVILLITPEMVAHNPNADALGTEMELLNLLRTPGACNKNEPNWAVNCTLGLQVMRDHLLNYIFPSLLPGSYGTHYGFNWDFWGCMRREKGGLIDPNKFVARSGQNSKWKVSPTFKARAEQFRKSLTGQSRLVFGLTPVPRELTGPNYSEEHKQMLQQVGEWIKADLILDLPATYSAAAFATATHLNAHGRKLFSRELAKELGKSL
jgi:hypothetical protein